RSPSAVQWRIAYQGKWGEKGRWQIDCGRLDNMNGTCTSLRQAWSGRELGQGEGIQGGRKIAFANDQETERGPDEQLNSTQFGICANLRLCGTRVWFDVNAVVKATPR
ncbi:hypothetical protein PspLS_11130, partial [Pyricularia sp. CBS 133598]